MFVVISRLWAEFDIWKQEVLRRPERFEAWQVHEAGISAEPMTFAKVNINVSLTGGD